jgi:hypothetical protein
LFSSKEMSPFLLSHLASQQIDDSINRSTKILRNAGWNRLGWWLKVQRRSRWNVQRGFQASG